MNHLLRLPLILLAMAMHPSLAAPLFGGDDLQRNGALSRHVWTPDFANGQIGGHRVSAGLALGLSDPLQLQLGRRVVPAFTLDVGGQSHLSLLPAGGRGVMLVIHHMH